MEGKALIISAPSGAGKTTIVKHLLKSFPNLEFSISATSRAMRPGEADGKDYFFVTADDFRAKIDQGAFIEWEEVYAGCFYGTLKSEIKRIWTAGHVVLFDVDVIGGINLKRIFGDHAVSVFIQPPSLEILESRLHSRSTDTQESMIKRMEKASWEMSFAGNFDAIIVNDKLEDALHDAEELILSKFSPDQQ